MESNPAEIVDERELRVVIRQDLGFSEYHGSRAQLEAEGLVPSSTKWPQGTSLLHWEFGAFRFGLRRRRPENLKGPMRLWIAGDWWCLRWQLRERLDYGKRELRRKENELDVEIYRQSERGQFECNLQWRRYWNAEADECFQNFKALCPGLIPPKRKKRFPGKAP